MSHCLGSLMLVTVMLFFVVDVLMKRFESISKEHLIRIHIVIFDRKLWKLFEIHFDKNSQHGVKFLQCSKQSTALFHGLYSAFEKW